MPIRKPEVTKGLRASNGTMFLLTVIPAACRPFSASLPVMLLAVRSISITWLSVPPETMA